MPRTSTRTLNHHFKFGLFEADLQSGTLRRQNTVVKLQEQPFKILALLLEAQGEVLSRDDLRKRIWPEGTSVDLDGSLNTALMKLRAALNDNAENPIFIETVPRKGYRFIAPMVAVRPESTPITTAVRVTTDGKPVKNFEVTFGHSPTASSDSSLSGRRIKGLYLTWWQASAIFLALFALIAYLSWRKTPPRLLIGQSGSCPHCQVLIPTQSS